jgi:hypothetical protein
MSNNIGVPIIKHTLLANANTSNAIDQAAIRNILNVANDFWNEGMLRALDKVGKSLGLIYRQGPFNYTMSVEDWFEFCLSAVMSKYTILEIRYIASLYASFRFERWWKGVPPHQHEFKFKSFNSINIKGDVCLPVSYSSGRQAFINKIKQEFEIANLKVERFWHKGMVDSLDTFIPVLKYSPNFLQLPNKDFRSYDRSFSSYYNKNIAENPSRYKLIAENTTYVFTIQEYFDAATTINPQLRHEASKIATLAYHKWCRYAWDLTIFNASDKFKKISTFGELENF